MRCASLLLLCCITVWAQEPDTPATAPGLSASYTSKAAAPNTAAAGAQATSDATSVTRQRCAALHVPASTAPAPGLVPGPFTCVLEGFLSLELRTKLVFSASGNGRVRVLLRGQLVFEGDGSDLSKLPTEPFRIRKGMNPLRIEYTSPPQGDATLRIYWQGDDFVREPLPTHALFHALPAAPSTGIIAVDSAAIETGRNLFAAHRCINCHLADSIPDPAHAAFGLGATAPSFARIGERLNPEWIARWILDPQAMRPGARMPRLLPSTATDPRAIALARSVAADLVQDAAPPPVPSAAASAATIAAGAQLVADLGCASCHVMPTAPANASLTTRANATAASSNHSGADTGQSNDLIPLAHVAEKFRFGALARFLADPSADHPNTRMPRFNYEPGETESIEAWLRSVAPPPPSAPTEPLPKACGVMVKFRCTQCHDPRADTNMPSKAALADIARKDWSNAGCASAQASDGMAHFTFSAAELNALERFRQSGMHTAFQTSAMEQSRMAVRELQCSACHTLDGQTDWWTRRVNVGAPSNEPHANTANAASENEKLNQTRPELTWAGEKLHQSWLRRVFAGEPSTRMRPWLRARMPAFPNHAALLARGLGAEHGFPETQPQPVAADEETLRNGRYLVSREGFGCTACHWLKGEAPYATFEFGATELALAYPRLRQEFMLRWMWKPQRVVSASRMPIYAHPAEPETAQVTIWDGDAQRQFAAMWAWLSRL